MEADVIVKPRDVMPSGASTLPAAYYTDRTYYQREMDALSPERGNDRRPRRFDSDSSPGPVRPQRDT